MNVRLMGDALRAHAAANPDHEAVIAGGERLTYGDLLARASGLAGALFAQGVRRGDRVAIFMDNSVHVAAAIYATWLAGGVITVINPQTKQDKLAYMLADSGASFLIADGQLRRVWQAAIPAGLGLAVNSAAEGEQELTDLYFSSAPGRAAAIPVDLAALIYTSGSTGNPKGVMMTHQSMVFTCGSLTEYLRIEADDRILNVLPLAFDYGLYQLLMAIHAGATVVLERNFSFPVRTLEIAEAERITVFPGVPTVFATLVSLQKRDPRSLGLVRRITNTAAHLPDEFTRVLGTLFPEADIYKMYGLTECKRVCYLPPELVEAKPGSVGIAIPGTEVFLLDEDGGPVAPGQTGILHVRGPHVMAGYWGQDELSAHMLKPGPVPGERMLNTHDHFRQDEDGFLYFVGRTDDIIKTRGEKVSPVEVENALHAIPGVREAAVTGEDDDLLGQVVVAHIVLEDGATLGERELKRHAAARLEAFMVPGVVRFTQSLPQTATGKVRKKDLVAGSE